MLSQYENIILLGHFNSKPTEESILTICQVHNLEHLIKESICFSKELVINIPGYRCGGYLKIYLNILLTRFRMP